MLHIITGARNEGKTRTLRTLYHRIGQGDGIVSEKLFSGTDCAGFLAERLATGERVPLAMASGALPKAWDHDCRLGRFSFSKSGLAFMVESIDKIIRDPDMPVFVDEIGLLELSGRGFHPCLPRVFSPERTAYITVRDRYLEAVLAKYRPEQYSIIPAVGHAHGVGSVRLPS